MRKLFIVLIVMFMGMNMQANEVMKQALIDEVLMFIEDSHTGNRVKDKERLEIATAIVENGLEHNIDICFILAQGKLETNLGELGIGKSRKSIFGIYRYFKNYSDGIDFYVKTLKKSYLSKNRTIYHLMDRYTTKGGSRYAENLNYERELKQMYAKVLKENCNIWMMQQKYKKNIILT